MTCTLEELFMAIDDMERNEKFMGVKTTKKSIEEIIELISNKKKLERDLKIDMILK